MDNLAIPAKAPHRDMAEKFINFILDAKIGARLSNFNQYRHAQPRLDSDDQSGRSREPGDLSAARDRSRSSSSSTTSARDRLYDEVWTQVKSK